MTEAELLRILQPLVGDLARRLPAAERYRRLLQAARRLLPADAVALLRLDGEEMTPVAVDGLSADTLGRRFRIDQQPRLRALLHADGPVRFAADCPLPDPYDGLVEHVRGHLPVHDCMGCVLRVDERSWGLLTLDALAAERFADSDLALLEAFASVAAATVHAAQRIEALEDQAERERQRAESYLRRAGGPQRLIGRSVVHRELLREIALVAPSELSVLLVGETGVGKELVADAIHGASSRAARPLVRLNCAALPEALAESELFGHVRGAFSGALSARQGHFQQADGGTLFLDEVGELSLPVQAKLLRALQEGQLQRVGSDREHRVDVRLIAATHRDLAADVRAGRFRADLYHRLCGYPLHVPPLRARGRDVLLIAGAWLEAQRASVGGAVRLDAELQRAFLAYDWPGNVRELEHLLGRAVLRAKARQSQRAAVLTLTEVDVGVPLARASEPVAAAPAAEVSAGAHPPSLRAAVEALERELLRERLQRHAGNWAAAARSLQVDRANLVRLARRLGVRPE